MNLTEFTIEELLALASGLGLRNPAFLAGEPFDSWTSEVRAEVDAIGRRSLAARSVVLLDDEGASRIPDVVAKLCGILSEPEVYIRISNLDPQGYRMASFLISGASCAGLRLTRLGNYRFTLIGAVDVRQAMADILKLDDPRFAEPDSEMDFEVDVEELQRVLAVQTSHPDEESEALLRKSGLAPHVAEAFLPLMTDTTSGWCVEVFNPSIEARSLDGSITTWITSATDIWMASVAHGENGPSVRYQRVTGPTVQASIEAGLPPRLTE